MASQLTIRGVPEEVNHRLKLLGREKGKSVNAIVIETLVVLSSVDAAIHLGSANLTRAASNASRISDRCF